MSRRAVVAAAVCAVPLAVLRSPSWADALVGAVLVGVGVAERRRAAGTVAAVTGLAWFAGGFGDGLVLLHRGPLVHWLVAYPRGWPRWRWSQAVVVVAYGQALAQPFAAAGWIPQAALDWVTLALAVAVPVVTQRSIALPAAAVVMFVLAGGAAARITGSHGLDDAALPAYQVALAGAAVLLYVLGRRTPLTGLVVELGDVAESAGIRDTLARTLGDPSLRLAYWVPSGPGEGRYADEAGLPVELTGAVTVLEDRGRKIAAISHDPAVLDDPALVRTAAALASLALENARLQTEVQERIAELESSRRRIVTAVDEERRRLERRLHDGVERRLDRVAAIVGEAASRPAELAEIAACRAELRAFARGVHPRALAESGLAGALAELCQPRPHVELSVEQGVRPPPAVEACAYFVCSEALANAAKHAQASYVRVTVTRDLPAGGRDGMGGAVLLEVADDGVGGADPALGSGLRGLADRVEALGGTLAVSSPPRAGTRLTARIPCG